MKKTLTALVICAMMLATILPISALTTSRLKDVAEACTGGIGRSTVRGIAFYLGHDATGKHMHLFAIRLHFITVSLSGERSNGVIRLKPIDIPTKIIGFHGRTYIYASFFGILDI